MFYAIQANLEPSKEKLCFSSEKVTLVAQNKSGSITDAEVLDFYNLATGKLLRGLEVGSFWIYMVRAQK